MGSHGSVYLSYGKTPPVITLNGNLSQSHAHYNGAGVGSHGSVLPEISVSTRTRHYRAWHNCVLVCLPVIIQKGAISHSLTLITLVQEWDRMAQFYLRYQKQTLNSHRPYLNLSPLPKDGTWQNSCLFYQFHCVGLLLIST